jgi:hypothetical protein
VTPTTAVSCEILPAPWDAELGEMSPQRVDQLRLLADQRLAHPVDRQGALLLLGLDRHEPHAQPLHCFADRFGRSFF